MRISAIMISLILLCAVFLGAKAHAQSRAQAMESLQNWRSQTSLREDLEDLEKDRRLEWIDRLLFQVERKQGDQSFRFFLDPLLDNLLEIDSSGINQSFGSLSLFLEQLRSAAKNLREPNEDAISFLQSFTEFSGLTDPATADEFAETRNYYDGRNLLAARPMSLDEAATLVETRENKALESFILSPPPQLMF